LLLVQNLSLPGHVILELHFTDPCPVVPYWWAETDRTDNSLSSWTSCRLRFVSHVEKCDLVYSCFNFKTQSRIPRRHKLSFFSLHENIHLFSLY